ncbi:peptidoglycan DD-metalloendopeptidase family protein [Massilia sp. IC2-477]|uniref:murein hydrolase activator EnvC family protein n=1 Tax=Massilia sp. IC2-477 TaxID=2887198 RepID=UPI001D10CA7F|nr:peptidoglycan DD-metalloendopeptidase family protein [Massilia sp. IC2-477]MCC2955135.1 peptidoglycan DD-metalloendopeptidase family protein [Massilia sp. IC2-477]
MPFTKSAGSLLLCTLLAAALSNPAFAQRQTDRSRQKATVEKQRAGIQQKLEAIKRDIARTEDARDDAADELAESEAAISDANRALRDLAEEQDQTSTRLHALSTEGERLQATIVSQKKQLSQLLREHYVAGNEDRIKLLLSGDNPNRINRDLQMMAYVSQAQAKLLSSLRANLAEVEANRDKVENAQQELQEIASEQQEQKSLLEKEKSKRSALLQNLSTRLADQRKQADRLQRDEQRMSGLVDRLTRLIREQAEAEQRRQAALAAAKAKAEAEEKARALARAKLAAEKAERERIARQNAKPGSKPVPEPEPPKVAEQPKPVESKPSAPPPPEVALAPPAPAGAFASLKGRMNAPVNGTIAARFGSRRGQGPTWKGTFIKAPEGTEVRAVGPGRVVHADWLRGWGNLIIIDHGGEYLTTYGNNSALLKRAGDMVKAGEVIASAGNTGGNEESGLYFELRHRGQPLDPAGWIKF